MISLILLVILAFCSLVMAGIFAGSETGMYRLSRLRLRLGVENKRLPFIILSKTLHDREATLISMLVGTNLAYYFVTSIVTLILLSRLADEHSAELLATVITAPVLFVFSELIPKNIFFYRADTIMPALAPILFFFHKVFHWLGIVPALKFVSLACGRIVGASAISTTVVTTTHRSQIAAILRDTHEEDLLSTVQSDLISRLPAISKTTIKTVMTPIGKTQTVDINADRQTLLDKLKESPFTRLCVYEHSHSNIAGFINIYEQLNNSEPFGDLRKLVKPVRKLSADITVAHAIDIMQRENLKIILVVRTGPIGGEKAIGIVTMKDLVEELLGELAEW